MLLNGGSQGSLAGRSLLKERRRATSLASSVPATPTEDAGALVSLDGFAEDYESPAIELPGSSVPSNAALVAGNVSLYPCLWATRACMEGATQSAA